MKISEMMTRDVTLIGPDKSISEAAKLMSECGAGMIPVGENDRLIGMITDRDIAIRAVANGLSPDTAVRKVMSNEVLYCFEDQSVDEVAANMGDQQVRRLPVLSRAKRLVGIISLGDLAVKVAPKTTGAALADISRPGGERDQAMH